jgi:hypothetical protein
MGMDRQAHGADQAVAIEFAEEDPALVLAHQRAAILGVVVDVLDDALHRAGILARPGADQPLLAHQPADVGVILPIVPGIADADHRAVGLAQPSRALHLQEEQLDRIGDPGQFQILPGKLAVLDLGALVIGDEMAGLVIAAKGVWPLGLTGPSPGRAWTRSAGMP